MHYAYLNGTGSKEGRSDGDNVYSQLELQELGNAVVDISTPHDGLDNACKVVVCQDNVACLLCNVCARNALLKSKAHET